MFAPPEQPPRPSRECWRCDRTLDDSPCEIVAKLQLTVRAQAVEIDSLTMAVQRERARGDELYAKVMRLTAELERR